jgi:hypothetical protein
MLIERLSRSDAQKLLRRCMQSGEVVISKHFREELANEALEIADAFTVLRKGCILNEPEPDIKSGEWKYRIEGNEPGGKWLAIVFCFKPQDTAFLITVFSVRAVGS